jgi:sugar O-acyltransferase (sialic acid O-acetyltransferase NeuD family)
MNQSLVIIGTGGNAYDILDIVAALNDSCQEWKIIGFLDDHRPADSEYLGFPVLGPIRCAAHWQEHCFINAIGSDKSYLRRPEILASTGLSLDQFATLIHPAASVSAHAHIGRGVYINYGVSVGGGVVIGNHVSLGPRCIIGHDTTIEDYAIVAPGAVISGYVEIGPNTYIGAAASIRQKLRIGEQALVGMGAVVVKEVAAGTTVVGNPASPLRP